MTFATSQQLPKGAFLGILGDGQLGRMLAQAAQNHGYRTLVVGTNPSSPAGQVADQFVCIKPSDWQDPQTVIDQIHASGQMPTRWMCEWENVPAELLAGIGQLPGVNVFGTDRVLGVAQDRVREKEAAGQQGIPATPWTTVRTDTNGMPIINGDVLEQVSGPCILKAMHGGYDGQQQFAAERPEELRTLRLTQSASFILEGKVDIAYELSIYVCRNQLGEMVISPAIRNIHRAGLLGGGGILTHSFWYPGCVPEAVEMQAQEHAETLAEELNLVSPLTVEFFYTTDGRLLFNEMAPRIHNSGHGTLEPAVSPVSHANQAVRVAAGLPLMPMEFERPFVMVNLLGELSYPERKWLAEVGFTITDYRKTKEKRGRKMGHATRLCSDVVDVNRFINATGHLFSEN